MQAFALEFNLSETVFLTTAADDGFTKAFVYCTETIDPAHECRARMFTPGMGVPEDWATGSATAAFARAFMAFEKPGDGQHTFVIEQGDAKGRPSRIAVSRWSPGAVAAGQDRRRGVWCQNPDFRTARKRPGEDDGVLQDGML